MNSINNKTNDINVTVDKRTELLSILVWISDYNKLCPVRNKHLANDKYIDNIINKFSRYKDEKAVRLFEELYKKHDYFFYDSPINLFLQLDEDFGCSKINDYVYKETLEQDNLVYEFLNELKPFADKIGFNDYYNSNIKDYEKYVDCVSKVIGDRDISSFIKNYYGYDSSKEFNINLLPAYSQGGYNVTLDDSIFCNSAVQDWAREDNLFPGIDDILVVHELSHGYVDTLTDKYKLVTEDTDIFDDIKEDMAKYAYPTDKEILNEHIIKGIECRYLLHTYNDENMYNDYINSDLSKKFKYLPIILGSLEEYENNRDTYKTFDIYYPKVIENIKIFIEDKRRNSNEIYSRK